MSRALSLGTPVPVCQEGLAYAPVQKPKPVDEAQLLGPPPEATRSVPSVATVGQPFNCPDCAQESFHVVSGIYDLAEACVVEAFVAFQYCDGLLTSSKSVPPTATLNPNSKVESYHGSLSRFILQTSGLFSKICCASF